MNFFVEGQPRPGGSKKAFVIKGTNRAVITDAGGKNTKEWRDTVASTARAAYHGAPLEGPLELIITFKMPRPKSHYRANGELKPNAPRWHTIRPDATKLVRSTEDALTHILWKDDAQIVIQNVSKAYADGPVGAYMSVRQIIEPDETEEP